MVNVYDNSIRYTDRFLAQTIDWLKTQQAQFETGLFYMSDHGESLGEMDVYLHGMPYAMAPEAQKHVPMIAWLSTLGARTTWIRTAGQNMDQPAPTTTCSIRLGLMDVSSPLPGPPGRLCSCPKPAELQLAHEKPTGL